MSTNVPDPLREPAEDLYELSALTTLSVPLEIRDIPTEGFGQVATSLIDNIRRTLSLATFTPFLCWSAMRRQQWQCEAALAVLGAVTLDATPTASQFAELTAELQRLGAEWNRQYPIGSKARSKFIDDGYHDGLSVLNEMMEGEGPSPIRDAIEALLISTILGIWTAFEVMAGDLWEAAVNAHPHGLAELKGKPSKWNIKADADDASLDQEDADDLGSGKQASGGKKVNLDFLNFYNYDLSKSMGTVLRKRFVFTALKGIQKAYCQAFHKDFDAIKTILQSAPIRYLSATRNILVHKSGKADREFLDGVAGFERFASIKKRGDAVRLTGEIVTDLVEPVIRMSCELIVAVNNWITTNPGRPNESTRGGFDS